MRGQECRRQLPHSREEDLSDLEDRSLDGEALALHTTPLRSTNWSPRAASTKGLSIAKRALPALKVPQRRSSRIRERLERSSQVSAVPPAYRTQPEARGELWAKTGTKGHSIPVKQSRVRGRKRWCAIEGVEDKEITETGDLQQPRNPNLARVSVLETKIVGDNKALPAKILRTRQTSIEGYNSRHCRNRAKLTRENLATFNKMSKKKGLINVSTSLATNSVAEPSSTGTKSSTAPGFAFQAYKNGILDSQSSKPPLNIGLIHENHIQPRHSPSPTESEYKQYVQNVEMAGNEATMLNRTHGKLLKEYPDRGHIKEFNHAFSGFPKDAGMNTGLSAPQPDFVEGLEMQEYYPFPIDEHIKGAVLYKDNPHSLTLPQLAGEWRFRGKDMDGAKLQSSYDGAALVYARNQALSYIGQPDPPGHSEVMTFTTDGNNLNLFAHHASRSSEDGRLQYHQYPVDSTNLTISHQRFKDGRRGLRNAQDWARQQTYILRDELKEHWKQQCNAAAKESAGEGPLTAADPSSDEMDGGEAS